MPGPVLGGESEDKRPYVLKVFPPNNHAPSRTRDTLLFQLSQRQEHPEFAEFTRQLRVFEAPVTSVEAARARGLAEFAMHFNIGPEQVDARMIVVGPPREGTYITSISTFEGSPLDPPVFRGEARHAAEAWACLMDRQHPASE